MIEGRSGGSGRGTRRESWAPPDSGSSTSGSYVVSCTDARPSPPTHFLPSAASSPSHLPAGYGRKFRRIRAHVQLTRLRRHSFPTRRSSDLGAGDLGGALEENRGPHLTAVLQPADRTLYRVPTLVSRLPLIPVPPPPPHPRTCLLATGKNSAAPERTFSSLVSAEWRAQRENDRREELLLWADRIQSDLVTSVQTCALPHLVRCIVYRRSTLAAHSFPSLRRFLTLAPACWLRGKIPPHPSARSAHSSPQNGGPKGKMIEGRSGGSGRGTRRESWAPPDSGSSTSGSYVVSCTDARPSPPTHFLPSAASSPSHLPAGYGEKFRRTRAHVQLRPRRRSMAAPERK